MKKGILCVLSLFLFIMTLAAYLYVGNDFNVFKTDINIEKNNYINEDGTISVKLSANIDSYKCSYFKKNDEKNAQWLDKDNCIFNVEMGDYYFAVMDDNNKVSSIFENVDIESNSVISSNIDMLDVYYLAKNGNKQIDIKVNDIASEVYWKSSNIDVVSVDKGLIHGVNNGTAIITAMSKDGAIKEFNVLVTDLIVPMKLDLNKPSLACHRYSEEEAALLDQILFSRVKEMGKGTRGGVVAAIRFLLLEFPYTIRYFNENGRLADHGAKAHIDAEGRYYHEGLYLSDSKFKDLEPGAHTKTGPAIWGCNIYDAFVDKYHANGFTCSGFVTWALLNGGLETGDVGAGDFKERDDDLSDLGPHQEITYDFMKNGQYKVGDFIARNGHAALIIGISDDTIYTAESLPPRLKVYIYGRYEGIVKDDNLTYIINMDNIYPNGEGVYTNMW